MRAQGTIEYLLIMAIIIVIGLVVVTTLSGLTDQSVGINKTTGSILAASGPISITEIGADTEGDGLINLQNNTGETLIITKIRLGTIDNTYDKIFPQGTSQLFSLNELGNGCSCIGNENTTINCEVTIYYTSTNDLNKRTTTITVPVYCDNNITTPQTPTPPTDDGVAPTVYLSSPASGATIDDFDFMFLVSGESVTSCSLIVDDTVVSTVTSPETDTNISVKIYNELSASSHTWDINCTNSGGVGTATDRTFTNPYTSYGTISACETTLNTSGSYNRVLTDLNVGGDCITVTAANITIDGNTYSITGNIDAGGQSEAEDGVGIKTVNLSLSGDVIASGADGVGGNTGGSGATVTLIDSNVTNVYTNSGNNESSGSNSTAGTIYFTNSTATGGLYAMGGDSSSSGYGDYGGSITATDSNVVGGVYIDGGTSPEQSGGLAQNIILLRSTTGPVSSKGGDGYYAGGEGGDIAATDSNINGNVDSNGGTASYGAAETGGSITLTRAIVTGVISSSGGNGYLTASANVCGGSSGVIGIYNSILLNGIITSSGGNVDISSGAGSIAYAGNAGGITIRNTTGASIVKAVGGTYTEDSAIDVQGGAGGNYSYCSNISPTSPTLLDMNGGTGKGGDYNGADGTTSESC